MWIKMLKKKKNTYYNIEIEMEIHWKFSWNLPNRVCNCFHKFIFFPLIFLWFNSMRICVASQWYWLLLGAWVAPCVREWKIGKNNAWKRMMWSHKWFQSCIQVIVCINPTWRNHIHVHKIIACHHNLKRRRRSSVVISADQQPTSPFFFLLSIYFIQYLFLFLFCFALSLVISFIIYCTFAQPLHQIIIMHWQLWRARPSWTEQETHKERERKAHAECWISTPKY